MNNLKIIYISCYSSLEGKQANLTQILYMCDALTRKYVNLNLILFVPFKNILNTKKLLYSIDKNLEVNIIPIPLFKLKGIYFLFDIASFIIVMPLTFFGYVVYTRNQRISRWIYNFKKDIYIEIHDLSKMTLKCLKKCKNALFLSNTKTIIKEINNLNLNRNVFYLPNAAKLTEECTKNYLPIFDTPSVGYIGSNNVGKGIKKIIELAKLNSKINYYLAGYIKITNPPKNVYLLGRLNKHQISEMLNKVDLLIAPYENIILDNAGNDNTNFISPLKVFEYMASKKPFIVSRLEFAEDFLEEGEDCLMAAPNDINDWLNKIEKLLMEKNLSKKLASNSFKKYKNNYTWEIRAEKVLKMIKKKSTNSAIQ